MVDHKPLPAIPPSNGNADNDTSFTELSIDARAHRSRLIHHFLSEINEPGIESKRDMWVSVFEDVLDEMGACVKEDSWLQEIRKMRERQREKRRAEKGKARETMAKGEVPKPKKTQSSGSGSGAADAHSAGHELAHKKDGQPSSSSQPSEDSFTSTLANDSTNPIESPTSTSEELAEKRLVLCVAPWRSQASVPAEDSGFALVLHKVSIGCVFTSGKFAFQDSTVLYGTISSSLQNLLGGTFTFHNLTSQLQHTLLSALLRVAIYIHLSLILEQHLLHDSHVPIVFPPPKSLSFPASYSALVPNQRVPKLPQTTAHDHNPMSKKLQSLVPSGILSFFSKKGIPHSTTVMPVFGSDLGLPIILPGQPQLELWRDYPSKSPRSSTDMGSGRIRTLSFLGNGATHRPSSRGKEVEDDSRGSPFSYASPSTPTPTASTFSTPSTTSTSSISFSFSATLAHIQTSCSLLSTSPGVVFPAPSLVVDLAEKEKKNPQRRLKGDERAGLGSLLGWEASVNGHGKDKERDKDKDPNTTLKGRGMAGIQGFLRHQALSVLVSHHVPHTGKDKEKDKEKELERNTAGSYMQSTIPLFTTCGRPRWRTLGYFSHSELDSQSRTAGIAGSGKDGDVEKDGGAEKEQDKEKSKDKDKDRGSDTGKDNDDDKDEHENQTLGDTIRDWVENSGEQCSKSGCTAKSWEHEVRYVHGGVKVTINVSGGDRSGVRDNGDQALGDDQNASKRDNIIKMWETCAVCNAHTKKSIMSDGTYLLSFGKFLELLIYSPSLCVPHPPLCAHTSPPPKPWPHPSLPEERLNIVRHFSAAPSSSMQDGEREVSFTLSPVDHVFELRVPRLQLTALLASSSREKEKCSLHAAPVEDKGKDNDKDADKKELRREIKRWWEGIADHMDALETILQNASASGGEEEDYASLSMSRRGHKLLPRLPSADEAYQYGYDDDNEDEGFGLSPDDTNESHHETPRGGAVVPLPSSSMDSGSSSGSRDGTVSSTHQDSVDDLNSPRARNTTDTSMPISMITLSSTSSKSTPSASSAQAPPQPLPVPSALGPPTLRLSALRHTFHRTEQSLYAQLARTSPGSLNDVRRAFLYAATGARRRLGAWQRKHVWNSGRSGGSRTGVGGGTATGASAGSESSQTGELGVEEPEWWGKKCHSLPGGSVIVREDDWGSIIAFTLSTADYQHELSSMLVARTHSSTTTTTCQAQAQPTTTASVPDTPTGQSSSSFFSAAISYKLFSSSTPTLPDPDQEDVAWSEPEAFSAVISRKEHPKDSPTLLAFREVLRQKSPLDAPGSSIISATSRITNLSTGTGTGGGGSTPKAGGSGSGVPPSAWAKPDVQISRDAAGGEVFATPPDTIEAAERILQEIEAESLKSGSASLRSGKTASEVSVATIGRDGGGSMRAIVTMGPPPTPPAKGDIRERQARRMNTMDSQATSSDVSGVTASSFTNTFTSGFSNVMRYMLHGNDVSRPSSPVSKGHHGLLSTDTAACIDERPHIKYDWTVGKRLKFSCTVYYARQFDVLRRRCAVDDVFVRSLSRSANWAADGGKSKSNFWKTQDERFIIKTLVDAWNVADLQFLLELAPSYFRYVDATASKATVLAKMMGFYTIEIRNLETGGVQSKADLLVMENLFYDQKVTKTFDLKGIQGRKVKPAKVTLSSKTLFDGEWIEGQQKTLMLVRPHSKEVLRAAIRSDAEFLSRSNIMDYSLLVGVDEERKQIACGLVDTIGSYTFAKTLEYKAKHGLNAGKEVTVVPPAEYQDRFVRALERYFLACPDKWSKPLEEWRIPNDPSQLPSVL